eukprot:1204615-Lingulodinium_polyedra.AAC.1
MQLLKAASAPVIAFCIPAGAAVDLSMPALVQLLESRRGVTIDDGEGTITVQTVNKLKGCRA